MIRVASSKPRNILILLSDQQRPDTIGAYWDGREHQRRHAASADGAATKPGARPQTPHLDRLAATGTVFERAYCAQPVCAPSRASILTGRYPHGHGLQDGQVLSPEVPTLAEMLRPAGYTCGYIGQWHLGHENRPQRGFEDFWIATEDGYIRNHANEGYTAYREFLVAEGLTPPDVHRDGMVFGRLTAARLPEEHGKPAFEAQQAINFLEQNRERPFFLLVTFIEPHPPMTGPLDDLFNPEEMTLPATWDQEPEPAMPLRYRLRRREVEETRRYLEADDERTWRAYKARYWGQCTLVDRYAGRILQRLDELGLAENTVVAYSTDHGDMMGEHRMLNKGVAYEGAVRVPLLIRAPGLESRRVITPVSLVQLAPTLIDLAGQPVPASPQGASMASLVSDGDRAPDEAEVVVEWIGKSGYPDSLFQAAGLNGSDERSRRQMATEARTLRRGRWKLTAHLSGEHQLFDLEVDPGETRNLYGMQDHEGTRRSMLDRLQAWQRRTGDTMALPLP